MPQRRWMVGCALCALGGLAVPSVAAQTPTPGLSGIRRRIIQQTDGPTPGYVTVVVETEVDAGALVARHTHPGIESGYFVAGSGELRVDGQPARLLKPGDGYQVPVGVPHSFQCGEQKVTIAAAFVVEKGKPMTSPA